jgi:hypothetical protein
MLVLQVVMLNVSMMAPERGRLHGAEGARPGAREADVVRDRLIGRDEVEAVEEEVARVGARAVHPRADGLAGVGDHAPGARDERGRREEVLHEAVAIMPSATIEKAATRRADEHPKGSAGSEV